jgi:hypothetical protein
LTCKYTVGAGGCACSIWDMTRAEYLFCCIHQYWITVQEICCYLSAWKCNRLETKKWSVAVRNKDSCLHMACWDFSHTAATSCYHSKFSSIALFAPFAYLHTGGMYKHWAVGYHGAEFFVVVPDIFGSLEWYLLHVTHTSGAQNFEVTRRFLEDSCTSWHADLGVFNGTWPDLLYVNLQHIVCVQIFRPLCCFLLCDNNSEECNCNGKHLIQISVNGMYPSEANFFISIFARSSNVYTSKTNTTKQFFDQHHRMLL